MSLITLDTESNLPTSYPVLYDLLDEFFFSMDICQQSVKTYRKQIKQFLIWLKQCSWITRIQDLTHKDLLSYKNYLIDRGKSAYTICGYLTIVRMFFEWLETKKIFPNIAKQITGVKKPKGYRKDCLTISQIKEALASFNLDTLEGLRNYAIFNLLVRTGLRTIEVARAEIGDLRQVSGEAILLVQGKGRSSKDEFVLILEETLKPIRKYLTYRKNINPKSPLFASLSKRTHDEPLKERSICWIIKETLRRIDLNDARLTTHSLRHTAVSLSVKNGASLAQAQAMARHTDPKTTMVYFHNHERILNGAERFIII